MRKQWYRRRKEELTAEVRAPADKFFTLPKAPEFRSDDPDVDPYPSQPGFRPMGRNPPNLLANHKPNLQTHDSKLSFCEIATDF
jgi:hypothetical protein